MNNMRARLTVILLLCFLVTLVPRFVTQALSNDGWVRLLRCWTEHSVVHEYPSGCAVVDLIAPAIDRFRAARRLDSSNASAAAGLGWTQMWAGDRDASEFAQEVAAMRGSAIAWLFAAILHDQNSEHALALQAWRTAGAAPYYYTKAETVEASGDTKTALVLYRLAVEIDPRFAKGFLKIGILLYNQGEFTLAVQAFQMALSNAVNRETYAWLGRAYQAMGNQMEAVRAYEKAAVLGELWYGYVALGNLYYQQGDYQLAEDWYLRAKNVFPSVSSLNIYLGDVALARHQYEESWAYYQNALSMGSPPSPRLYYSIGNWFYAQDDYRSALGSYEMALQNGLQPDYWYLKAYADSHKRVGNCRQALQNYRAALEFVSVASPENAYLDGQIRQLEQTCQDK